MCRLLILFFCLVTTSCATYTLPSQYGKKQSNSPYTPSSQTDVCSILFGASVISSDGEYLGRITGKHDSESLLNKYSNYGSEYSSKSIWNKYGSYGGEYAQLSPFNQYSTKPPSIVKNGALLGYLTVNKFITPSVNPFVLKSCDYV